MTKQSPI